MLTLIPFFSSSSTPKDDNDHTLVKLWQEYYNAQKADKPKDEVAALEKIKAEAKAQHLSWDYYDACEKFVHSRVSSNWKLRDSLQAARTKEIEEYGDPVAIYYMRRGGEEQELHKYIKENEGKLRKGNSPEFYKNDWRIQNYKFGTPLLDYLKYDYDYCIWSSFYEDEIQKNCTTYPLKAFYDYQKASNKNGEERTQALKNYVSTYNGKAAGLMAEEELLQEEFEELSFEEKGTSAQYEALRDKAKDLLKRRDAFKGDEAKIAKCCTNSEGLLAMLESKEIGSKVEDGILILDLQNIDRVNVKILKNDKSVYEKTLENPKKSYYAKDELRHTLPVLDDAEYVIKCSSGKVENECSYNKFTISAVTRWNEEGLGVWAVDYLSGEPLKTVDLEVVKDGDVVKSHKGLKINGFTKVPDELSSYFTSSRRAYGLRVRADGSARASKLLWPGKYNSPNLSDDAERLHCMLITDRSAFNPDETVHFKAILYKGQHSYKACGSGISVKAILRNAKNEVIDEQTLSTNESGSIAGDFILRRGERNGNYRIIIQKDGKSIATKGVRVDDFVLPTFDLVFDKKETMYYPISSFNIEGTVKAYSGHSLNGADISYTLEHNGEEARSGKITPDSKGRFSINVPVENKEEKGYRSDYYHITIKVTDVTGETMEFQNGYSIYEKTESKPKTEYYFEEIKGDDLALKVVAGNKETWALVELYGLGNKLIDSKLIHFNGTPATTEIRYAYKAEYPNTLSLKVIYFQDKKQYQHTLSKRREVHDWDLPLSFERFLDTTAPGADYTFTVKTGTGVEAVATVFDKSTERFSSNRWSNTRPSSYPYPSIGYTTVTGTNDGSGMFVYGRGRNRMLGGIMMSKSTSMVAMDAAAVEEAFEEEVAGEASMANEAIDFSIEEENNDEGIVIREDFATTIAWEPFLKSDDNGVISFKFTNADKLSTYYVQFFAHDKNMRNETIRREMVVTIPVKISLVEPQFLYEGDKWLVRTGLSSSLDKALAGHLNVSFLDGTDYRTAKALNTYGADVNVPAGGSDSFDLEVDAPNIDTLGIKITFKPTDGSLGSDGVFVTVPIRKPVQTLSEGHSALVLAGADKAAIERELRSLFVNVPADSASKREISILDMIKEAIPEEVEPRCENAIELSKALYAQHLCIQLGQTASLNRDKTIKTLLACRNEDGGFAWFKGMPSSPIVTAIVLQRLRGLGIIDEASAVKYIDKQYFNRDENRWWYCGLSMNQYLYTRSLFPEVKFSEKTDSDFRKAARNYLVPKKERGLNGQIFAKARRLQTLKNLAELDGGTDLAHKMGIKIGATRKINKSIDADVASLVQYAEKHKSGGCYYPNAVMPWRGLLEGELYAHTMLCNLMEEEGHSDIANGIRLWIMVQKETQHWENDPAYIEAIGCVLDGPDEVLQTEVMALTATYSKPFSEIKATGNGMSIKASVPDGTQLKVGDRVKLTFNISNDENRSFVKLTIPFNAGLTPVNQMSGYRWGYYRNVKAGSIEQWHEVYPEHTTTVTEEFYVTRAGEFQCPAATIECLYAPHYSANTDGPALQKYE